MLQDITTIDRYLDVVRTEMDHAVSSMDLNALIAAAELIEEAETHGNRVHVSGIGKPGHLAGYIASLFSSTGTPTYFLHGTEAVHGSLGQLRKGDAVIFISNSGETEEMKAAVLGILNNGCKVIGVTGNESSWLAQHSEVHLLAHVNDEGGPLNKAPRTSILAETMVLQALSIILQKHEDIDVKQYVTWHPGGMLGKSKQ